MALSNRPAWHKTSHKDKTIWDVFSFSSCPQQFSWKSCQAIEIQGDTRIHMTGWSPLQASSLHNRRFCFGVGNFLNFTLTFSLWKNIVSTKSLGGMRESQTAWLAAIRCRVLLVYTAYGWWTKSCTSWNALNTAIQDIPLIDWCIILSNLSVHDQIT